MKKEFVDYFYGLLLGDAGLRKRGIIHNANFYLTTIHHDYAKYVEKKFLENGFLGKTKKHSPGNMMKKMNYGDSWRFETRVHKFFTEEYSKWYKKIDEKNIKIIPNFEMNPWTLAGWYEGDGSNTKDKNSRKITLSSESFTEDEQKNLLTKLNEIGIHGRMESIRENKRIAISISKDVESFLKMVEPLIHPVFSYKIKYPNLKRIVFTRILTPEIKKELERLSPEEKMKRKKELMNKRRKKRYHDEPEYAEKSKKNSKINYQNKISKPKIKL